MAPPKPAKTYIAKAIPADSRSFYGQWAWPGMAPELVSEGGRGAPSLYGTEEAAAAAARDALVRRLQNRFRPGSKAPERYQKMVGPDFAVKLAEANITPTFFAYLWGTSLEKVYEWMDSVDKVPHAARLLLDIFAAFPDAIDVAEASTDAVTTERNPRKNKDASP